MILDTETTGRSVAGGHRIVSIGGVEIIDGRITGNEFEYFCNPERDSDPDARRVHGISDKWLAQQPTFRSYARQVAQFIGEDRIVAHGAPFDRSFLNNEYALLLNLTSLSESELNRFPASQWKDSLQVARKAFPKQNNSLDGLCDRFMVERSHRIKHGALKDARLLARVWIELCRGGQGDIFDVLSISTNTAPVRIVQTCADDAHDNWQQKSRLTQAEIDHHSEYWSKNLGDNSLWAQYAKDTDNG